MIKNNLYHFECDVDGIMCVSAARGNTEEEAREELGKKSIRKARLLSVVPICFLCERPMSKPHKVDVITDDENGKSIKVKANRCIYCEQELRDEDYDYRDFDYRG